MAKYGIQFSCGIFILWNIYNGQILCQTAEYVRFRRDLGAEN